MTTLDGEVPGRALPLISVDNRPYYDGCARGELWIQRCLETGRFQFYPRPCSIFTAGPVEWTRCSGLGAVHTFTIIRKNHSEAHFEKHAPYVVAIIELEVGIRMMSNVTRCKPEDVRIGMEVEVHFACVHETSKLFLPFWHPRTG
jgi:uncharacterized OB-fold protein